MSLRIAQPGQDDDSRFGRGGYEIGNQRNAAVASKIEVKQNDVWVLRTGESESGIAIPRFTDDRHVRTALNDHTQAGSHDGVIVDQKYPNEL